MKYTVALDVMGGDLGAATVMPAAQLALHQHADLELVLVGQEHIIHQRLAQWSDYDKARVRIHHASEQVGMEETPSLALRQKKDSSMRVAINLVKEGTADACVSAGNTGALMATAKFVLKTVPGIDRPAICTPLPALNGDTYALDLGANVDCKPRHLLQFGIMGSVLVSAVKGRSQPRVGLLNVGVEKNKGNELIRDSDVLLAASHINYVGFVEGNDLFGSSIDVVVCDGFIGNIMLKSTEGFARLIKHYLESEFKKGISSRLAGLVAWPVLRRFGNRIDPRRYNGASFLGLRGVVVKSHGGADPIAYANAIGVAITEVRNKVPLAIEQALVGKVSD